VWNFGHSCDWVLQCSADFNPDDNFSLTFELISIDSWSRERTEGYASYQTKLTPSIVDRQLLCYREVGENPWLDRLQRMFIGGRRQFEQRDFDGAANRYGNTTISTGSLDIRLQLVMQRHPEKVHTWEELEENDHTAPNRPSKVLSTDDILIAYQKARSKLEALTKDI
jgi:Meckel syndrome type 1 protein